MEREGVKRVMKSRGMSLAQLLNTLHSMRNTIREKTDTIWQIDNIERIQKLSRLIEVAEYMEEELHETNKTAKH